MSRGAKIALGILVALAALLAINTLIVNGQTKDAGVTIDGGQILHLPSGDVQVLDSPALKHKVTAAPIVLLHCYGCSMQWWDRLAPLLQRNHRVVRIDLLGFGGSEKPTSGYSMEDQAATVAAALNQLGIEGAVVVGHSMGFSVATALASEHSELVDRLVDIDEGSSTADDCSLPFIAKLQYVPVLGQALWRVTPNALVKDGYSDAFAPDYDLESGFDNPDQVVDDYDAMTFTAFEDSKNAADDYSEEISLADRLRTLAIPLLVVYGSEDQICDPDSFEETYGSIPGARVEEVDGAGHSPNVEKPEETAALIEPFAAQATAPPVKKGSGKGK
jgi:pimeloyl-ACP methyl ester carboxylesterase